MLQHLYSNFDFVPGSLARKFELGSVENDFIVLRLPILSPCLDRLHLIPGP